MYMYSSTWTPSANVSVYFFINKHRHPNLSSHVRPFQRGNDIGRNRKWVWPYYEYRLSVRSREYIYKGTFYDRKVRENMQNNRRGNREGE